MKIAAALALCLLATPVLADAVTYKGTIGKLPIVVELSEEPGKAKAEIFGRYFYADKGIDIPLHATQSRSGKLNLVEEVPCKEDGSNCPGANGDTPTNPPLGAKWALEITKRGEALEGDWKNNGRSQPVTLTKVGSRPFELPDPALPTNLIDFANGLFYEGTTLTAETSPYDFIKMDVKLKEGEPVQMGDSSFRYASDPRTLFQFPQIIRAGDTDLAATNTYLQQRYWAFGLDALWCEAQIYQGFGWNEYTSFAVGTLGEYDNEEIAVTYLSPTVLSWTESGGLFCGGAHPYNHHEFFNLDTKTGKPLEMSSIFKGWVAKDFDNKPANLADALTHPTDFVWGPDEGLAKFVKDHRKTNAELGLENADDCPMDDLIDTNLAISFKADDTVLFALGGLPNVIVACGADLYEAPIADLKDLLAPGAEAYFPSLKS